MAAVELVVVSEACTHHVVGDDVKGTQRIVLTLTLSIGVHLKLRPLKNVGKAARVCLKERTFVRKPERMTQGHAGKDVLPTELHGSPSAHLRCFAFERSFVRLTCRLNVLVKSDALIQLQKCCTAQEITEKTLLNLSLKSRVIPMSLSMPPTPPYRS